MLRVLGRVQLWRGSCRFSDAAPQKVEKVEKPEKVKKYLVFPTKMPIFPHYTYFTRINQALYDMIKQNNLKYVVALPLKEGAAAKEIFPDHVEQLQEFIGKEVVEEELREAPSKEDLTSITGQLTYDEIFSSVEEKGVGYVENIDDVYPMGSLCKIRLTPVQESEYGAYLRSDLRFQINPDQYKQTKGVFAVSGKIVKMESVTSEPSQTARQAQATHYSELFDIAKKLKNETSITLPQVEQKLSVKDVELLSGFLCSIHYLPRGEMYSMFHTVNIAARLGILIQHYNTYLGFMSKYLDSLKKKNTSSPDDDQIKAKLVEIYNFLRNMLNPGGSNDFIRKATKELEERSLPKEVKTIVEYELKNMAEMQDGNPELNRKKHFVTTILSYPFGVVSEDNYDIQKAQSILDDDHYGMKPVKRRILEFIAVGKLKGGFRAKVLLLYGPPGVGKSSIAKSIARCLGRSYQRISLGGQHDPEMIRGHRKTYVGAYPGRIFDAIKKCKTENPVILLDEIDKIETGRIGNLQEVIMEVLDPVQNKKFKDEFLDLELDLSNVLFICTANTLETIFPPLLDRLERIEVSGYTLHEKKEIFRRYLLKKALSDCGLTQPEQLINLTDEALEYLINGYCREAGVRSLDQQTHKICQKAARLLVEDHPINQLLDPPAVKELLGLPKYDKSDYFSKKTPVGVITGLAYTPLGGCTLFIEAEKSSLSANPSKPRPGSLIITGNLQDVMKESCQLAYSYAKYLLAEHFNSNYLETNDVHLNFPEIEIGKDGPSAGIAITTVLLSLALNRPAIKQIAMTGEINLSGNVMPIGGVKQKILGAKRESIGTLIFPLENKRDVDQLQPEVKEGVTFVFASQYREVIKEVFGIDLSESKGASLTSPQPL